MDPQAVSDWRAATGRSICRPARRTPHEFRLRIARLRIAKCVDSLCHFHHPINEPRLRDPSNAIYFRSNAIGLRLVATFS